MIARVRNQYLPHLYGFATALMFVELLVSVSFFSQLRRLIPWIVLSQTHVCDLGFTASAAPRAFTAIDVGE